MKVAFYTLGCKLNQAETETLAGQFSEAGFQLVPPDDLADIYIANTCTVTHIADRKSRHWLRLARRRNPRAFIIAIGCYAQRAPEELALIADLVLGNEEKERLLEIVAGLSLQAPGDVRLLRFTRNDKERGVGRVRSLIKIQDGCYSPCTYCIVPSVRAYGYSLPASQIIEEIKRKVALGYKEVVLTGTKVGCYEDDGVALGDLVERILCNTNIERLRLSSLQPQELSLKFVSMWQDAVVSASEGSGADLGDLVERILCDTNIERLRLSSLQPQELSPKFVSLWQDAVLSRSPEPFASCHSERSEGSPKNLAQDKLREGTSEGSRLCRHFHLALQSGSDTVLRRMRRCYSLGDYQKAMALIRQIPGVAITTDIMVGFPGESDEEFEQSYSFCWEAGFANIHVFPFSPRPGTAAVEMPNQVRDEVKKERSRKMLELSWISKRNFEEQFLGQTMWVLWEKEINPGEGIYSGLTDNYIRVFTRSEKPLTNKILPVKLMEFHDQGMWGELVNENSRGL